MMARLLFPAVLVIVAGVQRYRVSTVDQSAWLGGGFAMFSTIDQHQTRFVWITVRTADGATYRAEPGPELDRPLFLTRAVPSERHLNELAQAAAALRWQPAAGGEPGAGPDRVVAASGDDAGLAVVGVEIDLHRIHYDPDTDQVTASVMATASAPVPGAGP